MKPIQALACLAVLSAGCGDSDHDPLRADGGVDSALADANALESGPPDGDAAASACASSLAHILSAPTNGTDVSGLLQAQIDAIPDGVEGAPVCIRLSPGDYTTASQLALSGRHHLVLVADGGTIHSDLWPAASTGATFAVSGSTDITIRGLRVVGPPNPRFTTGWNTDYPMYSSAVESRHGIAVYTSTVAISSHILIEGCHVEESRGDGVYLGGAGNAPPSSDVTIRDTEARYSGRHGVGIVNADGVRLENVTVVKAGFSCVDAEANGTTQAIANLEIAGLDCDSKLIPISITSASSVTSPYGIMGPIHISDCSLDTPSDQTLINIERKSLDAKVKDVLIEGSTAMSATAAALMSIVNAANVTVRTSHLVVTNTAKNLYGVSFGMCTGSLVVANNDWDSADWSYAVDSATMTLSSVSATGNLPNNLGATY